MALPDLVRLDNKIGMGAVHRNLGCISYLEGNIAEGDREFGEVFKILEVLKSPAEEAETYFKQGTFLHKAGINDRAREAFSKAEERFRALGATKHIDDIAEALKALN